MGDMPKFEDPGAFDAAAFLQQLGDHGKGLSDLRGFMFQRCVVHFRGVEGPGERLVEKLARYVKYAGGRCADSLDDTAVTHVVIAGGDAMEAGEVADGLRREFGSRRGVPRLVTGNWVEDCWKEKTLLDEEQYAVR